MSQYTTMEQPQISVEDVARLARLELEPDERVRFQEQLDQILAYFDRIRQVPVDGVEPTAHTQPVYNVFREDEPSPGLSSEEALGNAPQAAEGLFIVPRIVETS